MNEKTQLAESTIVEADRVGPTLVKGKRVYQTHAYLIRRTIARDILDKLEEFSYRYSLERALMGVRHRSFLLGGPF